MSIWNNSWKRALKKEHQHFNIEINGRTIQAHAGQTLAATLIAAGITTFRQTLTHEPRGLFCGMGVCFECLVTVNGIPDQRACMTSVQPEMKVTLNTESNPA
jgi:predicted molibdopterin-dependent oxidoreductase YjgC